MKSPLHRLAVCAGIVLVSVCALAASASAKEEFVATLTSTIPADAEPGTTITVSWKVSHPVSAGRAAPFNATGAFVRLRGAGGAANEGFASPTAHTDGAYTAQVKMPQEGITAVQIGVAGTRTYASGKSERSDWMFPISNPPDLAAAGGSSSGTVTLTWALPLLAALALVGLAAVAVRRRVAGPRLGTRTG
jgi:hypothetical protein